MTTLMATTVLPVSASIPEMTRKVQQAFALSMELQFGGTETVFMVPNVGKSMDMDR